LRGRRGGAVAPDRGVGTAMIPCVDAPVGLARIHRLQLFGVAHQHDPRHLHRARDAQQRVGANAAGHRGLVHRQNRAPVLRPSPRQPLRVREVGEAGQEVLQRPRGDTGLPGENPGGDGRRRQALYLPLPEQLLHLAQHGRFAAAGVALHADHEIVRQEHRTDRLLLAPGEARRLEPRSMVSAPASAMPFPRPARIDASTRRSAFTARSVTKARSIPRRSTSISSPSRTSRAITASTSASV